MQYQHQKSDNISENNVKKENTKYTLSEIREKLSSQNCIICHEPNPNITTLCCLVPVHVSCFSKWMQRNPTCMVCRTAMITENEGTIINHSDDNEISNENEDGEIDADIIAEILANELTTNNSNRGNDSVYEEDGFEFYSEDNIPGYIYSEFIDGNERFSPDPEETMENDEDEEDSNEDLHFLSARLHALGVEEEPYDYHQEGYENYVESSSQELEEYTDFVSYEPPPTDSIESNSQPTCPCCWGNAARSCVNSMCARCCKRECRDNGYYCHRHPL